MPPGRVLLLLCIASAIIVGTALASQYLGGLEPCEICLYERWPYYAVIVLAGLGTAMARSPSQTALIGLIALIFAGSAVLGLYHVAIEQHWIEGPTACTGGIGKASSPEALLKALMERQPVQCDVPQWSFMGITLAGLNLIASIILAAFAFWSVKRR
jgi:disulfide bond formation protein DsbB